jgi:hypothetical protein
MSSSKYTPPHLRNMPQGDDQRKPRYQGNRRYEKPQWQIEEEAAAAKMKENQERGMDDNESNFPALSTVAPKIGFTAKRFADIALAGHEKSEREAQKKVVEEKYRTERYNLPLPVFHNVGHFVEPEDDRPYHEPAKPRDEDGWVTVDRKKYRSKKATEDRPLTPEEEQHREDTVWDQPEEHETCWDERY